MELRHLRYFVAVAEAGNLSAAAKRKLHTSQPSLSRQIRDLEKEVGTELLTRSTRGIELTPAGRTFLYHARLVLSQVEAAGEAARRVAQPAKPCFAMGFLTGHELNWMPETLKILHDELANADVMISSHYSPRLAEALSKGKIDAAFLRREEGTPDLSYELLCKEPLVVILPGDHRLARQEEIALEELEREIFLTVSDTAPVLRAVIDDYLKKSALAGYAKNFLLPSLTSRPLKGEAPTIELVLGYRKSNESPILKLLLSRREELVARVTRKVD